jgi:serine/threonine protein kinase
MDDSENLYSTNLKALKEWKQILNKKLSQSGFHKNYRPIKKIGKGSFASVYLAIRLEDDKRFAVKAFSKENCYSE